MKEYKILVRADGGKKIGLGHWSRCLFLTSCLEKPSKAVLFTFNASDFNEVFPDSGIGVRQISSEEDFLTEVSTDDLVILDDYKFDGKYVNRLSDLGALILYVDDFFNAGIKSDVIINHCPGSRAHQYKSGGPHTSYFLGPDYSLIAGDFSKNSEAKGERMQRALVCMGGADPNNNTVSVIEEYIELFLGFRGVDVIVGGMYPYREKLEEICQKHKTFRPHFNLDRSEVSNLMKHSGVAIMSSSTMALEYAHVRGLLTIKETADNQKCLYQGLINTAVAVDVKFLASNINTKASLYAKLTENQDKIFDGKATARFEKLFKELAVQQQLVLRKAMTEDVDITFEWASDKAIRAFSFSKEEITREGHAGWFQKKINSKDCLYYIAFLASNPVGSVRFDLSQNTATISYLVDKQHQGLGLGRTLLAEGIKRLIKEFPGVESIIGHVMDSNIPSIKVFEKLGFRKDMDGINQPHSIKFYKELQR